MPYLPTKTLRDLALVAVLVADVAWDGAKEAMARLRPYVHPPADLRVRSSVGGLYTGLLLVDRNEILAGFVIRAGHEAPPELELATARRSPITRSPSPRWGSSSLARVFEEEDEDDNDSRLPGWGEDPRDVRDPWRR